MSRTMIFLKDQGISSYDELVEKTNVICDEYNGRLEKIRAAEDRMKENPDLQKQIGTYGKTREVFSSIGRPAWIPVFMKHTAPTSRNGCTGINTRQHLLQR